MKQTNKAVYMIVNNNNVGGGLSIFLKVIHNSTIHVKSKEHEFDLYAYNARLLGCMVQSMVSKTLGLS